MTWETLLIIVCCSLQIMAFGAFAWAAVNCFRGWSRVKDIIMQMDELIDGVLGDIEGEEVKQEPDAPKRNGHRDRLAALAAGGQAKQYLGTAFTVDQINSLKEEEVEKLHARYEARLGSAMTKTLGQAALQLYAGVASLLLPIPPENRSALVQDLEGDPFVGHALGSVACELYHRYGMFLAPLTAALTTAKHCRFERRDPDNISPDGESGDHSGELGEGGHPGDGTSRGEGDRPDEGGDATS